MIKNKKERDFYIMADRMMNRGYFKRSLLRQLYELFIPDVTMDYLSTMRKMAYISNCGGGILSKIHYLILKKRFIKLGYKLGYSIGINCFGYGLTLQHHGTIIIGGNNVIGNYALINTCTCIIRNASIIGNGLFMGAGAKIIKQVNLKDNVLIGSNAVVSTSFEDSNILLGGIPAKMIKGTGGAWYDDLYGDFWIDRHNLVETLKAHLFGDEKVG